MAKTYTADKVSKNHDFDFSVDDAGNITKMVIKAEVNYGTRGFMESLDIWPMLNQTQKDKVQQVYDKVARLFNNQFLGGN